jgi:hypothetical protein
VGLVALVRGDLDRLLVRPRGVPDEKVGGGVRPRLEQGEVPAAAADRGLAESAGVLEQERPLVAVRVVAIAVEEFGVALVGQNVKVLQVVRPAAERRLEVFAGVRSRTLPSVSGT